MELIINYGDPYSFSIKGKKFTINSGGFLRGICLSPITFQNGQNIVLQKNNNLYTELEFPSGLGIDEKAPNWST